MVKRNVAFPVNRSPGLRLLVYASTVFVFALLAVGFTVPAMNTTPLAKLAGMAYHGGKTPEHWIALVGVDPRKVDGIQISRGGLCYWTPRAEVAYRRRMNAIQSDMRMLLSQ